MDILTRPLNTHQFELASDEPLSAYLSRLAAARGVRLWDYRIHRGILARYNKKPHYYERVAAATGIDAGVLKRHDLVKNGGTFSAFGMTFDVNDIWAKSARVCPCCIREDIEHGTGRIEARPRLRFGWMLRTLGHCAKHGVPLTVVGSDYDRISYGDLAGTLALHRGAPEKDPDVGNDAAAPAGSCILASDVYFQRRVASAAAGDVFDALVGAAGDAPAGGRDDPLPRAPADAPRDNDLQMLDALPVPAALLLTEVIGGMELFGDRYSRRAASGEDRQTAVAAGYQITRLGHDGLREFLRKRDARHWHVSRRGHFKNLYGRLQELLSSRTEAEGYGGIIRFVAEHAHSNHALGPEDAFLGLRLPRRLHSIRTAEVEHGIHRITLRSILESAGLLPAKSTGRGDGRVVIASETFDKLIGDWRERLPAEEAKARFGVSGAALEEIVRHGLLAEKDRDRRRRSRLSRSSYLEFCERLDRLPRSLPRDGMKTLQDMTRVVNRSYAEIIALILDGTIASATVDERKAREFGFDSIFVDPLEVKAAFHAASPPGITFQCTERMLGTTTKTVRRLAAAGLLKTVVADNPLHRTPQTYILPAALEDFQRAYISLFEYAKGRGQIALVKKRLAEGGMVPAFEEPGAATFYRREGLPGI
ncbi:TniQ family protein [Rhizobium sp. NTR19]|uniref:TniQ family protein n=1 Tax=Neorhizobium turbinariae TaxID=2937795 RepID=A0ABT0ISE2_9HYPH|nr:TniQ family protein [Neorhizobium turbinariae]MCK8780801.1 TniQ family protein [Neorhizobium turbinariae]